MEEISRESNIDSVVWLLIIITLTQAYHKAKVGQKDTQNVQFEDKRARKLNTGAKVCAESHMEINKRPDSYWNKGRGALRVKSHPSKLPT